MANQAALKAQRDGARNVSSVYATDFNQARLALFHLARLVRVPVFESLERVQNKVTRSKSVDELLLMPGAFSRRVRLVALAPLSISPRLSIRPPCGQKKRNRWSVMCTLHTVGSDSNVVLMVNIKFANTFEQKERRLKTLLLHCPWWRCHRLCNEHYPPTCFLTARQRRKIVFERRPYVELVN